MSIARSASSSHLVEEEPVRAEFGGRSENQCCIGRDAAANGGSPDAEAAGRVLISTRLDRPADPIGRVIELRANEGIIVKQDVPEL
jgi:hypothetical protein